MNPRTIGMAQLLFAATAWGTALAPTKAALDAIDAFHLTSIRFGVASLVFLALLARTEGWTTPSAQGRWPHVVALGIIGVIGGVMLMVVALGYTRAEHAGVIVASQPLITACVGWVLHRRRPARSMGVAIAVALAGVTLVVTRGGDAVLSFSDSAFVGDLMALGAVLCWVAYTLGAQAFSSWSPLRYTALTMAGGTLAVFALNAVVVASGVVLTPAAPQLAAVGWQVFYITVVAALLGTLCWNSGMRRVGADGFLFINLVPVSAYAVGVAQGSRFNWSELLGAGLVMGALVIGHAGARRRIVG